MKKILPITISILALLLAIISMFKDNTANRLVASITAADRAFSVPDIIVKQKSLYDVRAYGAVGTDTTDDTDYIQAAIDSAYSDGGGTVYFPPGDWYVTTLAKTWDTTGIAVNLMGAGKKASYIRKYGSGSDPMLDLTNASDQLEIYSNISNLAIVGSSQGSDGIELNYCARFRIDNVDIRDCDVGIDSKGSLVYSVVRTTIADCNIGLLARKTGSVYANHIVMQDCEIISNDSLGIDFGEGSNFKLLGCDIELNGTTTDTTTGGIAFRKSMDDEIGFATATVNNCWFESNYGIALQTEPHSSIQDIFLTIENTTFLSSEGGNACVISDIEKLVFLNSHAATAAGDTVDVYDTEMTFFVNSRIICLNDNSNNPTHYNVDQAAIGLSNYGNTEDVYISNGHGLYMTWSNGSGTHSITPDTSTGYLEVETYSTNPMVIHDGLTVGSHTVNVARSKLAIIDSSDCASLILQGFSGGVGKNRWWISGDTTSNVLQIGADGNTKPSDYAITINDGGGSSFRDSVQINSSGTWVRKLFSSTTSESLGITYYNTTLSRLDTVWIVQ